MGMSTTAVAHWLPEASDPPLREVTLGTLLAERAAARPECPALIFDEPDLRVSWTYAQLDAEVTRLAKALLGHGIGPGDRVAVMAANCPEWVLLEYALGRIGAVLVTVNPSFRSGELDYLLRQARVSALFIAGDFRGFDLGAMLAEMLPALDRGDPGGDASYPDLRRVVQIGAVPVPGALAFDAFLAGAGETSDAALAEAAGAVRPEDVLQIQYTSGTTGKPKGAMLSHRGTINNALLAADRAGYRETDVMVSAMPLFHTAGCVCNVMGMLAAGGCLVAMADFDAGRMLDLIEAHGGTITNGVPTMYIRMLQDPRLIAGARDLSSWRIAYTGGTSIPPQVMLELQSRVGCEPVIIMGMTECSPIITQTVPEEALEARVRTAGVPLPHVEIRIVDPESGETRPVGAEGELQIRGFLVTAGYFDMPDQTAAAISPGGWLKSGDLAVMDAEGHLRIIGRIKDMLIRGGENIYPVEIEDWLMQHPAIAEAQVVGVPDAEFGEEIFAFVVLRAGEELEAAALRDWCRARIARHKVPRHIAFIEVTPKTANGKVRKIDLRRMAEEMLEKDAIA
ncbi:fatty-acyl-CoA synthase [Alloyangia pacifica]|uniref:3-methylmercaptopropionyl-CoA ligase n=2 Tax=Alloyangia pacifica TaxID=311180 RepID=A0A1I6WCL9_9RHOB|nr:fatty-acyl-CoA synthase [Alloyangia pacifica]SFT23740.1 fatty-acyl-CoA synthase [Alloyangia pacifica]